KRMEMYKDEGIEFGKGGKGGFTPEMREKMVAANAKADKAAYKDLESVLKPEQITRLKQIERQALGVEAFSNEEVATTLKLNDQQKSSVKGITGDFQKDRRELMGAGGGGKKGGGFKVDPETQGKIQKLQKEAVAKV